MRWTTLLVLSIAVFFSACSTLTPQNKKNGVIFERKGVSTLLMPSGTREVYFKSSKSFERHCRAPGPDFTVQNSSGISLGVSLAGKSDGISDSNGQAGLSLGGRNPSVLLTRELMYRACELASNLNADQNTTIEIYNNFFKLVEKSIELQKANGTVSTSDKAESALKVHDNTNTNSLGDGSSSDYGSDSSDYGSSSDYTNN